MGVGMGVVMIFDGGLVHIHVHAQHPLFSLCGTHILSYWAVQVLGSGLEYLGNCFG
jgi:hypothetical protein